MTTSIDGTLRAGVSEYLAEFETAGTATHEHVVGYVIRGQIHFAKPDEKKSCTRVSTVPLRLAKELRKATIQFLVSFEIMCKSAPTFGGHGVHGTENPRAREQQIIACWAVK